MKPGPAMHPRSGFTLLELLVVIAIIGILAVMVAANWQNLRLSSQRTASLSNLRQIGAAVFNYAGENEMRLPRRVVGTNDGAKWPRLLAGYLEDVRVYAAVGDRSNYIFRNADPLSDARNNTSYIMNGYNDLGAYTNAAVEVRVNHLDRPAEVILLGTPQPGSGHFYMDMLEGSNGNHQDILDLVLYGNGSDYLFADGSARFLTTNEYRAEMWLVNRDFPIP
jgi:prepilin-type N-terminal cleavage/methylation domain-containing protein/prepilin-type processing-associated H-X9-DG protein